MGWRVWSGDVPRTATGVGPQQWLPLALANCRPNLAVSRCGARGRATLAASHRVLRAANGHDLAGRAAEAAFFAALGLLPAVLTLVAVLRAGRPAFGSAAAPRVSGDLARLLRVVLATRGGVAADSADSLLRTTSRGRLGVGTLVAVLVLARGIRSGQRGLTVIPVSPRATPGVNGPARECPRGGSAGFRGSMLLAAFGLGPLLGHSKGVGGDTADTVQHSLGVGTLAGQRCNDLPVRDAAVGPGKPTPTAAQAGECSRRRPDRGRMVRRHRAASDLRRDRRLRQPHLGLPGWRTDRGGLAASDALEPVPRR